MDDEEARFKARMDELDENCGVQYYDREGKPVSTYQYLRMVDKDRRVALTKVGPYNVSTVWLGMNHSFGHGPPIIFETMIYWDLDIPKKIFGINIRHEFDDSYQERYSTEEEALAGHQEAINMVRLVLEALGDEVVIENLTEKDKSEAE